MLKHYFQTIIFDDATNEYEMEDNPERKKRRLNMHNLLFEALLPHGVEDVGFCFSSQILVEHRLSVLQPQKGHKLPTEVPLVMIRASCLEECEID